MLPRLQTLLTSLGGKMPTSTKLLIGLSEFAIHYGVFVVLAALFGQPIVPYGHHQDFVQDMAAVRTFEARADVLRDGLGDAFPQIEQAIRSFDFEGAQTALAAARPRPGAGGVVN